MKVAEIAKRIFKLRFSIIFPINDKTTFTKQDKLEFINLTLRVKREFNNNYENSVCEVAAIPSMQVHNSSKLPFIWVLYS